MIRRAWIALEHSTARAYRHNMSFAKGKGKDAWEDDHYDDYDEDEEYEEYGEEEEDYALAQKREEDKKAAAKKAAQATAKKAPAKPKAEPAPKKVATPAAAVPLTTEDKLKIKEDNRKMNYQLSAELFGGADTTPISRPDIKLPEGQTFESFTPKTEAEFELLAQYVGRHIAVNSREFYYPKFIKSLLSHAFAHLQPSDIEDVGVAVSALQAAKEAEIQAARSAAAQVKTRDRKSVV